jgi:hypothetical protein
LVVQQTCTLRGNAILIAIMTVKLALKRFHPAWVDCGQLRLEGLADFYQLSLETLGR